MSPSTARLVHLRLIGHCCSSQAVPPAVLLTRSSCQSVPRRPLLISSFRSSSACGATCRLLPKRQRSLLSAALTAAARVCATSMAATAPTGMQDATADGGAAPWPANAQNAQHEARLLEAFASIPSISQGWCIANSTGSQDVVVIRSQRNLPANAQRQYMSMTYVPAPARADDEDLSKSVHHAPFPVELKGAALVSPSPSGRRLLVVRAGLPGGKPGETDAGCTVELWNAGRLLKEIAVPEKVHGGVYADGWFEGVAWSSDEKRIAYIAQQPRPEKPSYGGANVVNGADKADKTKAGTPTWKGSNLWNEDWGEQYTDQQQPGIFILDSDSAAVTPVHGTDPDMSCGQVVWAPDGSLVFVGWTAFSTNFGTHRKLGIVYCQNRPCSLYATPAPTTASGDSAAVEPKLVTASFQSAFSPRFSMDGKTLVFLSTETAAKTGAHNATAALHAIDWPSTGLDGVADCKARTIIAVVDKPSSPSAFPGLYCYKLPRNPWCDASTIALTTTWGSQDAIIAVDLASGQVRRVTPDGPSAGSWQLLDVNRGLAIASNSTPAKPATLHCARPIGNEPWHWTEAEDRTEAPFAPGVEQALASLRFRVIQVPVTPSRTDASGSRHIEAIIISKQGNEGTKAPTILSLHGGPHAVFTTGYMMPFAYLASLDYNLILVNYRGSIGFGEAPLQSLLGNIGRQDVSDCMAALEAAVKEGTVDTKRVAVIGGSHGGFLTAHLIGQAPDRFKAAILRNPVCNIAQMCGVTDIPDWCFVETLGSEHAMNNYTEAPSADHLKRFYAVSPITFINRVKTPSLFLLGAKDRRVPVSSGLQYVYALRERGVETNVLMFPEDTHAINKPCSEFDSWLQSAQWLKRHVVDTPAPPADDE
eukprot:jgi/Chlat1/7665/Chrsp64S00560